MAEFKMVDFVCTIKMQVKVENNATQEEVINKVEETFDLVHEYGSKDFDQIEEYSAYMELDNIRLISIEN